MKENFSNLVKEIQTTCMSIQVQEAQRVPNKMDAKKLTPRHITIKMPKVKDKERILKAAREKWGVQSIRLSVISKKKKNFCSLEGTGMKSRDLQPIALPSKDAI